MFAPVVLLVLAIGLAALAWLSQGAFGPLPLAELAALIGIGAVILGIARLLRGGAFWRAPAGDKVAVLDGSNILYWAGDGPDVNSLRRVVAAVRKAGYHPVVWCDANAGYLIENRYAGPVRLSKLLGLSARDVFVVPKGEPADPHIIADARQRKALIVTNDRYRDWQGEGELEKILVKGQITAQGLVLHWPQVRRVPVRVPAGMSARGAVQAAVRAPVTRPRKSGR